MSAAYYSPALNTFIPAEWKNDGTYSDENWPEDAVLLTEEECDTYWKQTPPEGQRLAPVNGLPGWVDLPPPVIDWPRVNRAVQNALLAAASSAMTPLLVSLQLGDATGEEIASAKSWQAYVRDLKVVDLSVPEPAWPVVPV
ncbi:tail fiber assembly protein [Pseudomonas sp. RIT623]|uniref:tail fiber assembly protein n=1 Tax=Pseudomonas sp. RIT623 TaxID=2559075 RepID=UPI001430B2E0|nr:tail fiber assembly protein [Pseudomonas sp. RIT623]